MNNKKGTRINIKNHWDLKDSDIFGCNEVVHCTERFETNLRINEEAFKKRFVELNLNVEEYNLSQLHVFVSSIQDGFSNDQVKLFQNPAFSYEQMQQIKFGIEKGIDVSVYADPSIEWRKMFEIRLSLTKNT